MKLLKQIEIDSLLAENNRHHYAARARDYLLSAQLILVQYLNSVGPRDPEMVATAEKICEASRELKEFSKC